MFFFAALSLSKVLTTLSEEKSFLSWMRTTNNFYTGEEYHFRFGIYLATSKYVQDFNRQSKSYKLCLNKYACFTPQEYQTMLGSRPSRDFLNRKSVAKVNSKKDLPESVDWREKGKVYAIKDQGACGSCWAFGAIQAQESTHAIATGQLIGLSESNLVDCADIECHGCDGGWSDKALTYVITKQGGKFNLLSDYPYTPLQQECKFDQYEKVSHISQVLMLPQGDEDTLKDHLANVGPVAIAVDSTRASFHLYSSGIYEDRSCSKYTYSHAMGIVGYGVDAESQKPYWIIRNSWATSWGEDGYMRILRGEDICNVADAVFYTVY